MKTILAFTTGFFIGALTFMCSIIGDSSHSSIDMVESVHAIVHKN